MADEVKPEAASAEKPVAAAAPTAPEPTPAAAETVSTTDAAVPATEEKEAGPSPIAQLWKLAQDSGHPEIWGVTLDNPDTHIPSQIVFQKYLNANDGDLELAKTQLQKTLEWRKKAKPLELINKTFSKTKYEGLGYVTTHGTGEGPEGREVFTWNIYGGVKSISETFGNVEE